ncbi:MAG: GNAT family N-acetyltransferase [Candidatus Margulisiibacteriota bacterium]
MKLTEIKTFHNALSVIKDAEKLCKSFDPESDCKSYLIQKINSNQSKTFLLNNNSEPIGIAIIEIIERMYGNIILHCIDTDHEPILAQLLKEKINNNILELIQFTNNFNYRDTFIHLGFKEKERARMIHHDIGIYADIPEVPNIQFEQLNNTHNEICGQISYSAHKHRQHIECYDVYSSEKNRSKFASELRMKKHGQTISESSLLMLLNNEPVGLIEVIDTKHFNEHIGWIMDVALRPSFQGLGYGQLLIKKSLCEAYKIGYNKVGLGVTLNNTGPHQLYQNLGFEEYEIFVEIINM